MATDPTEVHPEFDHPRPDNISEWSQDQIDRYNELKEQEHEQEAKERERELSRKQRETLSVLESATGRDSDEPTDIVELDDARLEVKTRLSGELEQKFDTISKNRNDLSAIRDALIDACFMLIVDDDEPENAAYDFTDREVWESYYEQYGSEGLIEVFDKLAEPAMERRENVEFRGGE